MGGIDRLGNKYWFLCRRMIIEKREGDGVVAYYTTKKQLEELFRSLDPEVYEHDLLEALENVRDDIEDSMELTESLTAEKKPSNRQSYLELENASIEKMQQKRADLLKQELEEKMREEENKDRIKNEETEKIQEEEDA